MNSVKTSKLIRLAACALLCPILLGAASFVSFAQAPETVLFESVVEPGDLTPPGEPDGPEPADGADATGQSAAEDDGQVLGISDEKPGISIFWAIVIALFVAGAVVFGIVLIIPHDGEDPA